MKSIMKMNYIMTRIHKLAISAFAVSALAVAMPLMSNADDLTAKEYMLFDETVFYDGYKTDVIVDADADDGILRHSNSLYACKIDPDEFARAIDMNLQVLVGAMCDNYDRMGRVNLAFVEKGAESYDPESTQRIEIARFITPFMNKNRLPNVVPYIYDMQEFGYILKSEMARKYDLWLETEIFGVPYSANQIVKGCAGRNDVFNATVSFQFSQLPVGALMSDAPITEPVVVPITISKSEIKGEVNFNNYKEGATDTIGVTTRTFTYTVPEDLSDAEIVMILTNHGAEEGGEEYERRKHLVYLDGELSLVYTPGGVSCEPYRKYSTQKNMLFDESREDSFWEEISNWCPGQAVPTRRLHLGAVKAGEHKVMIRVPDAEFVGNSGDFRPSLYFLGLKAGNLHVAGVDAVAPEESGLKLVKAGVEVQIEGEEEVREVCVYSYDGRLLEGRYGNLRSVSLADYPAGQYIVVATGASGRNAFLKVAK